MAPLNNIPDSSHYAGIAGCIFGLMVTIVLFFWRIRDTVSAVIGFFVAVGKVADLEQRISEVEKHQITRADLETMESRLVVMEERLHTTIREGLSDGLKSVQSQAYDGWKRIDDFIKTIDMIKVIKAANAEAPPPVDPPTNPA